MTGTANDIRVWGGLTHIAKELLNRYNATEDYTTLQGAIICLQSTASLCSRGVGNRVETFSNLALAHFYCFRHAGRLADLNTSIFNGHKALDLMQHSDPRRPITLSNLAQGLLHRFRRVGGLADFDEAIMINYKVLEMRLSGHPGRVNALHNLADALLQRFKQFGDYKDLDDTILKCREALKVISPGHPTQFLSLNCLADALWTKYELAGDLTDLDESISNGYKALKLTPHHHPSQIMSYNNLANATLARFLQSGVRNDLDDAILNGRKALELRPPGHPDQAISLNNLANALLTRFDYFGDQADLDDGISSYRSTLECAQLGHYNRCVNLNNLARALLIRFRRLVNRTDLEDAIACHREVIELVSPDQPIRSTNLHNLANALMARFVELGDCSDLDQAIGNYRCVLEFRPPGHPKRAGSLNCLAEALLTRFDQTKIRIDLDESISTSQDALKITRHDHPNRPRMMDGLARGLLIQFWEVGDSRDLDEAITIYQSVLELRSPGHPDRPLSTANIANALLVRFQEITIKDKTKHVTPLTRQGDLTKIFELFEEATSNAAIGSPRARLLLSLAWAEAAMRWSHPSTIKAHQASLKELESVVTSSSSLQSKHVRLTSSETLRTRTLAMDGAACALASGQVDLAVEMLEQGRNVLLTQAGRYRTRVDDLEAANPTLAKHFRALSMKMENSAMSGNAGSSPDDAPTSKVKDLIANYQYLSQEWTNVIDEIRLVAGFGTFLTPPTFSELQKAAVNGPVIIINQSWKRTDAIIIRASADPLVVPLPDANPKRILKMVDSAHHRTEKKAFKSLLRSIWSVLVNPIVQALQTKVQLPLGSRIWWCPTGTISHLPLHAAGDYTKPDQNLPDLYVSSYIPTLSALIRTHKPFSTKAPTSPRLLIVSQSETPGQTPLPSVPAEIEHVKAIVKDVTVLDGACCTRDAVSKAIAHHPWIHLSCHGHLDEVKPFESSFALHDGPLTLLDIARQDLPHANLAFLSACHSAESNRDRPDEALHLTAGLQFAGFRTVIGTLWAMCDDDGPVVAEAFYSSLLGEGGKDAAKSSAHALHEAVQTLRKCSDVSYSRWACFVHFGS